MNQAHTQVLYEHFKRLIEITVEIGSQARVAIPNSLPAELQEFRWFGRTKEGRRTTEMVTHMNPSYEALVGALSGNSRVNRLELNPRLVEVFQEISKFTGTIGKAYSWWSIEAVSNDLPKVMMKTYFNTIKRLLFDEKCARKVCEDVVSELTSDSARWRSVYLVQNFSAPKPFSLRGNVTFFPVTMEHVYQYGRMDYTFLQPDGIKKPTIGLDEWLCVVEDDIEKRANGDDRINNAILGVVNSLQLTTKGRAAFHLLESATVHPYLWPARKFGGQPHFTSRNGVGINLIEADILSLNEIYPQIRNVENDAKYNDIALPLRRLRTSSTRIDYGDHLLDCVIALEYLLVPNSREESGYKFRVRGAALLSEEQGDFGERLETMKTLYEKRSAVVHGRKDGLDDLAVWALKAEDILRELTLWYLLARKRVGNREQIAAKVDAALVGGGAEVRKLALTDNDNVAVS